jgi:hypothetical protein
VSRAALEAVVNHEGRLDLLCCLLDGAPLSARQLSARIGRGLSVVGHWVKLLEAFDLIGQVGDRGDAEALYAATLDEQPDWVREAVENHRR